MFSTCTVAFGAAIWMRRTGRVIEDVRIAYGGVGPMVMRMSRAEAVLRGQPGTLERFEQAGREAQAEVTPITDLWIGLIKAPVFGFIIALAGCFQGMLVQGNSEEVGLRTTTAVVQSIFLVIVLDAVFAVFFSSIGWR